MHHSDMLGFYFVLFASITVTWANLLDSDRLKLEIEDFDLPCCNVLKRNFSNFGEEILALHSTNGLWGLCSLFCCHVVYTCSKFG